MRTPATLTRRIAMAGLAAAAGALAARPEMPALAAPSAAAVPAPVRLPPGPDGDTPVPTPDRARLLDAVTYELEPGDWASPGVLVGQLARLAVSHAHTALGCWDRHEALLGVLRERCAGVRVADDEGGGDCSLWDLVDDETNRLAWSAAEWGARFAAALLARSSWPHALTDERLAAVVADAMEAAGPMPAG